MCQDFLPSPQPKVSCAFTALPINSYFSFTFSETGSGGVEGVDITQTNRHRNAAKLDAHSLKTKCLSHTMRILNKRKQQDANPGKAPLESGSPTQGTARHS